MGIVLVTAHQCVHINKESAPRNRPNLNWINLAQLDPGAVNFYRSFKVDFGLS